MAARRKRLYDVKAVNRKFPVGSWVLRYYPPASQKNWDHHGLDLKLCFWVNARSIVSYMYDNARSMVSYMYHNAGSMVSYVYDNAGSMVSYMYHNARSMVSYVYDNAELLETSYLLKTPIYSPRLVCAVVVNTL